MTDSVILPPVVETNTNFATLLGTIDIGSDAKSILMAMLNRASVKQFNFDDYGFSDPVRPIEDAPIRNTLIRLLPSSLTNQYGSTAIYYNRMHISVLGDIRIFKNGASLISEVIPYINSTYGIYLSPTDYIDGPLPVGNDNDTVSVSLTISPTCVQFYGGTKIVLALPETIQVDKAHIGLSNANNTADVDKPVSTAQAQANTDTLTAANAYSDSIAVTTMQQVNLAIVNSIQTVNEKETADINATKAFASALVDSSAISILSTTNNAIAAAIAAINLPPANYDPAAILTQASSVADAKDTALRNSLQTQWVEADDLITAAMDAKDLLILDNANNFTSATNAETLIAAANAANVSAISKDLIVLNDAKIYADTKLVEAKTYTDSQAAAQIDVTAILDSATDAATVLDTSLHSAITAEYIAADASVVADIDARISNAVAVAKNYSDTKLEAAVLALDNTTVTNISNSVAAGVQTAEAFAAAADDIVLTSANSFASTSDTAVLALAAAAASTADTALAATLAPVAHTHVVSDISDFNSAIFATKPLTTAQKTAGALAPVGVNTDNITYGADGTLLPGSYIGTYTTVQIDAMNTAIGNGANPVYPVAGFLFDSTLGAKYTLKGIGLNARFTEDGLKTYDTFSLIPTPPPKGLITVTVDETQDNKNSLYISNGLTLQWIPCIAV